MKKYFNLQMTVLLAAIVLCASCSKSPADAVATPAAATSSVTAALTQGIWVVSSFVQKTEDKTSKFSDVSFVFSADGKVTITQKGSSSKGTWQFTPAVTYYGATSKDAIALNAGAGTPLNLLTKTWNMVSSSATTLKLDSPELTEDEHVQFSKQ